MPLELRIREEHTFVIRILLRELVDGTLLFPREPFRNALLVKLAPTLQAC